MKREATEEFLKALKDFNDFLENPEEVLIDHNYDTKTYKVVITGLDYVDAQNIVEMGMEYGKTVEWSAEGDDEDGEE